MLGRLRRLHQLQLRRPFSALSPSDLETLILRHYRDSKFHDLLLSVVSHPSLLLAAALNLKSPPSRQALKVSSLGAETPKVSVLEKTHFAKTLKDSSLGDESLKDSLMDKTHFGGTLKGSSFVDETLKDSALDKTHFAKTLKDPALVDLVLEVSSEIRKESGFDVEAWLVNVVPSRKKGKTQVLPNLKLKVALEAVRMTLEVIYEKRFVTFSYGGRSGLGRHTAVRYLKSSVKNPNWWFRVAPKERFGADKVQRLTNLMAEKIADLDFLNLIRRLFEVGVVIVELGGTELGRGFPQECGLCAILVNIYFHGFDHAVQELRMQVQRNDPRMELPNEESHAFHNPVRLYVVRYLDEILVVSSGSKLFTMDVRDKVVGYLENNLNFRVDKMGSAIHSAVSEKMGFMGMELQAVPPSVLHPPMSEKAMRARKKYLKRKTAKALELKSARETRRRKLAMEILHNVTKKFVKVEDFGFEFRIEDEVREIFGSWADDVVREFLSSKEECWNLHRALSAGDFLELKKIRDQLPINLVDSYDIFQEKLKKYLMPHIVAEDTEEESSYEESGDEMEVEDKVYADRTVKDLTTVCMRVNAPIELVRRTVKLAGFTNSMGRPRPIKLLICLEDRDIIKWYAGVGKRWLDYFCCCRNFKMVKIVVNYHLRFSCFLTLAEKHEATKLETIRHYTKDLKTYDLDGTAEVNFPTEREIRMMGDKNLSDPKPVDGAVGLVLVRLASDETSSPCVGHFCENTDVALYRLRLLQNRLNINPLNERKWDSGLGAIDECLNKKCLSLCSQHASDLYMGNITLGDVDCTSFVDVE